MGKKILNDCTGVENEDFAQRRFLGNILRFVKGNRLSMDRAKGETTTGRLVTVDLARPMDLRITIFSSFTLWIR